MTIISFLKLQWAKRKLILVSSLLLSMIIFSTTSSYKNVHFKLMNLLTGDYYYSMFTVMLPDEDLTKLLIQEAQSWSSVVYISEVNTQKIISNMKSEYKNAGIVLPALITEKSLKVYTFRIDPSVSQENVEKIREKITAHYSSGVAVASPIKPPQLDGKYNLIAQYFLHNGVFIFCILISMIVFLLNAIIFYSMVSDAKILHSIHRHKAISLKNYMIFQTIVFLICMLTYAIVSRSISFTVILVWISVQFLIAFLYYGIWGKKYQV